MHTTTPARRTRTRSLAVALACALALTVLAVVPIRAQAAQADAITSVTVNPDEPGKPINVWDHFTVRAAWAAPSDAKPGDTFELTLPGFSRGVSESFALRDKNEDSQHSEVGSCTVLASSVLCTLSDYVQTHENVSGTLFFKAQATREATAEEWIWTQKGGTTIATPEAGAVGPAYLPPLENSEKWSWQRSDNGDIRWAVMLLGRDLLSDGLHRVTLTDTFDDALSMSAEGITVESATRENYAKDSWTTVPPSGYVTIPTAHGFVWTLKSVDRSLIYRIYYDTPLPAGTRTGDTFTNTVTANGKPFLSATFTAQNAGGDGGGDRRNGSVGWRKVDRDGRPLAGSEWSLTDADGRVTVVKDAGTGSQKGLGDADPRDGELRAGGLAWGTYTLRETRAPAGYELDPTPRTVVIDSEHLWREVGPSENAPLPGTLTWEKVDGEGAPLPGSEWLVTGPDGTRAVVVDNGENDKDPEAGRLRITGLAWGRYFLEEYRAPLGYARSERVLSASVGADELAGGFGAIVNEPLPTPGTPGEPTAPGATTEPGGTTAPSAPPSPETPGAAGPGTPGSVLPPLTPAPSGAASPSAGEAPAASRTPDVAAGTPTDGSVPVRANGPETTAGPERPAAAAPTDAPASTAHPARAGHPLASTGASAAPAVAIASLLLIAGLGLRFLPRRRRPRHRRN